MATIRICNVEGCQRKHVSHGLCQMHYNATPAARATRVRYRATPAGKASKARYKATPAGRAAQARHRAAAKERAKGLPETPQAPTLALNAQ